MTLEDRVSRLEQRINSMDRIERTYWLDLRDEFRSYRHDFNSYREQNAAVLGRILATLEAQGRRSAFRWPWEPRP